MQIVSAYLLAASAVDNGNYDEEYDIDPAYDFQEYMDFAGDDIVGDYVELGVPTGGSQAGNFDGTKFCSDWLSAFTMPIEYAKIFSVKGGYDDQYPDTGNPSDWAGFTVPFDWQTNPIPEQAVQSWIDNEVYQETGHHANFWIARLSVRVPIAGQSPDTAKKYGYAIAGAYLPSSKAFRCTGNYPTQGYATFELDSSIYFPYYTAEHGGGQVTGGISIGKRFFEGVWDTGGTGEPTSFVLVYNQNVFKSYLNRQSADTLKSIINSSDFALMECNISKNKR